MVTCSRKLPASWPGCPSGLVQKGGDCHRLRLVSRSTMRMLLSSTRRKIDVVDSVAWPQEVELRESCVS